MIGGFGRQSIVSIQDCRADLCSNPLVAFSKSETMIELKYSQGDEWVVTVKAAVTTHHRVRATKTEIEHLAQGRPVEELLEQSFQFLLEREPNTSILPSLSLSQIARYFPEYRQEIHTRLGKRS